MNKKLEELKKKEENAFDNFLKTLNDLEELSLFRKYITARHLRELENIKDFGK